MALLLSTQTEAPISLPPMSTVEIDLDSNTTRHVLKQEPISITLDGQSIFILATLMALIIHFAQPRVAEAVIVLAPLLLVIWNDYQNFLNLGPGGTPSTFKGYVHIAWLRLWAMRNPYVAEPPDPLMVPKAGLLNHDPLPFRSGPRPWVAGIAPHRQLDQHGCDYIFYSLRRTLENVAATNPEKYGIAISCFEKNGLALFARHPINKTCHGEIVHCHMSDHSMHLSIHPDDSRELLEKAWGQRHPLAWKGWFGSMPVPENFVMVYSPRNEQELRVVCRIIEAAMWYVTGEKTEIDVLLGPKTALTSAT